MRRLLFIALVLALIFKEQSACSADLNPEALPEDSAQFDRAKPISTSEKGWATPSEHLAQLEAKPALRPLWSFSVAPALAVDWCQLSGECAGSVEARLMAQIEDRFSPLWAWQISSGLISRGSDFSSTSRLGQLALGVSSYFSDRGDFDPYLKAQTQLRFDEDSLAAGLALYLGLSYRTPSAWSFSFETGYERYFGDGTISSAEGALSVQLMVNYGWGGSW